MDGSSPVVLCRDAWAGMIFSGGWGRAAGGVHDVVVARKADPRMPISGGITARVFDEAGLPPDLSHIIPGGEAGAAQCEVPAIGMVPFVGSPGAGAFQEESFGPVAVVVAAAVDEDATCLSEFGLASAIIAKDTDRSCRTGVRLKMGHLHINDQTVMASRNAPFGGRGAPGNGSRDLGGTHSAPRRRDATDLT